MGAGGPAAKQQVPGAAASEIAKRREAKLAAKQRQRDRQKQQHKRKQHGQAKLGAARSSADTKGLGGDDGDDGSAAGEHAKAGQSEDQGSRVDASSSAPAVCEDLFFFHRHLELREAALDTGADPSQVRPVDLLRLRSCSGGDGGGGSAGALYRVDQELLLYRHHERPGTHDAAPAASGCGGEPGSGKGKGTGRGSLCWATPRRLMMRVRVRAFERRVLARPPWCDGFTVWGAGRDGRTFVNELSASARQLVKAFCDVDEKKVGQVYYNPVTGVRCDIVHFMRARPPIVCCVALDRGGAFEANVEALKDKLHLREGVDLIQFC